MAHLEWQNGFSVGLEVLDQQHMRIIDYLNALDDTDVNDRALIARILDETIDYTQTHFTYEETLMEEASYPFLRAHTRVHELFTHRVADYKRRFDAGEDVARELHETLAHWLVRHIKREDADYAKYLRAHFVKAAAASRPTPAPGLIARIRRFFADE